MLWLNTNILDKVVKCLLKGCLAIKLYKSYSIFKDILDKINIVFNVLKGFCFCSVGVDYNKTTRSTV